jgi:hypothetical protein
MKFTFILTTFILCMSLNASAQVISTQTSQSGFALFNSFAGSAANVSSFSSSATINMPVPTPTSVNVNSFSGSTSQSVTITATQTFNIPGTFSFEPVHLTLVINSFSFSISNWGPGTTPTYDSNGFKIDGPSGILTLTMQGTYTLSGSSETQSGTFSTSVPARSEFYSQPLQYIIGSEYGAIGARSTLIFEGPLFSKSIDGIPLQVGVSFYNYTTFPLPIPEPSTIVLACLGTISVIVRSRKRKAEQGAAANP